MKFICSKSELSEAIGNVSRAVSPKSTIPALEGIKVRVSEGQVEPITLKWVSVHPLRLKQKAQVSS